MKKKKKKPNKQPLPPPAKKPTKHKNQPQQQQQQKPFIILKKRDPGVRAELFDRVSNHYYSQAALRMQLWQIGVHLASSRGIL